MAILEGVLDISQFQSLTAMIEYENSSHGILEFAEYAIEMLRANSDFNPLLMVDCRSFEYAQPPGAQQKACAVSNFVNTFYTAGI